MIDWVPIVLVTFKVLVFGIGMYFAIKWHYDQGKKKDKRALLVTSIKVAAIFVVSLLILVLVTFFLAKKLGLDLTFR